MTATAQCSIVMVAYHSGPVLFASIASVLTQPNPRRN